MTAQEQLQKLALYAAVQNRLANPKLSAEGGLSILKLVSLGRKLRKQLLNAGIDESTLNLPHEELTALICNTLQKYGL